MCKILHPDFHNNTKEANVIFNLLHQAYETLSDPIKRRSYNSNEKNKISYETTSEIYDEIITGYKQVVKDYENTIKLKNQTERALLEEIRILKNENEYSQPYDSSVKSEKNGYSFWFITLLIIIGIVALGSIMLIISNGWWLIIGIIILPIWLVFNAFKHD